MPHFYQAIAWTILALVGLGCSVNVPQSSHAHEENSAKNRSESDSVLISVEELKKILDSDHDDVRIIEASTDLKKYQKGHIPGAVYVHWLDDMISSQRPDLYSNPTSEQLADLMSQKGISNQHRIIIYDRFASRLSTRLYWTLKCYDHKQVQILNGGYQMWQSKYELSDKTPDYPTTKFLASPPRPELLAGFDFVKSHLNDPKVTFIDGRPKDQYTGKQPGKVYHTGKPHANKGHIPAAANVFWKDNFNPDGTFKSVPELKKLYADAGVQPDKCVVTYCNEGLHAAPPWFVLTELLSHKDVRLYDNSMGEWANADNPVETKTNSDQQPVPPKP